MSPADRTVGPEALQWPSRVKTTCTDLTGRSASLPATVRPTIERAGSAKDKAVLIAFPIRKPDVAKGLHDLLQQYSPMLGRLNHHNASPVLTKR